MKPMRLRRRPPPVVTKRRRAIAACAAHLEDLERAHRRPPADVAVAAAPMPSRLAAAPASSGCGSPAASCAELAR
jgi:hypothetical protein